MVLHYKAGLKRWALDLLSQRIATANEAMQRSQEAANSEEKSVAGDVLVFQQETLLIREIF